jgi:rubrerythrin
MLASERAPALTLAVRATAPLTWRSARKRAEKLARFAATEAGSALDMLKAAELEPDPKLRLLFFRHALDEARHAEMFRTAAQRIAASSHVPISRYARVHAVRQNLYETLGRERFVAFVAAAERKGQQHFAALAHHFRHDAELHALFDRVEKDERFHVRYAERVLREWARQGGGRAVRRARLSVLRQDAWRAWRRAGRRLGDTLATSVLAVFWLVALPTFVLAQRVLAPARAGWRTPAGAPTTLDDMRSQF